MKRNFISYEKTDKFSRLVLSYLNEDPTLNRFINHFPRIDNFYKQIKEKTNHNISRELLV